MCCEWTEQEENEYFQLMRESDALYSEVGERVWFALEYGTETDGR